MHDYIITKQNIFYLVCAPPHFVLFLFSYWCVSYSCVIGIIPLIFLALILILFNILGLPVLLLYLVNK